MAVNNPSSAAPYIAGVPHPGLLRLSFRIQSAGADTTAPDFVIPPGVAVLATSAATGVYTITLAPAYRNYVMVSCVAATLAAVSASTAQQIAVVSYVPATGVLTLQGNAIDDGAAAYVAENEWIMVDMVLAQDVVYGTAGAIPAA